MYPWFVSLSLSEKEFPMKKLAIVATLALASIASAGNLWVECGLGGAIGSLVKDKNPGAAKVLATITNVTWDLGTTATSSAVSTPDLCANKQVAAAKFITDTYASLEIETAKGEGQNLTALLDIVDVDVAQRAEVIAALRAGLAQGVATPGFSAQSNVEKAQGYYAVLMTALERA